MDAENADTHTHARTHTHGIVMAHPSRPANLCDRIPTVDDDNDNEDDDDDDDDDARPFTTCVTGRVPPVPPFALERRAGPTWDTVRWA